MSLLQEHLGRSVRLGEINAQQGLDSLQRLGAASLYQKRQQIVLPQLHEHYPVDSEGPPPIGIFWIAASLKQLLQKLRHGSRLH